MSVTYTMTFDDGQVCKGPISGIRLLQVDGKIYLQIVDNENETVISHQELTKPQAISMGRDLIKWGGDEDRPKVYDWSEDR